MIQFSNPANVANKRNGGGARGVIDIRVIYRSLEENCRRGVGIIRGKGETELKCQAAVGCIIGALNGSCPRQ